MAIIGRDKTLKKGYMLETLLKMFDRNELNKNHPLQRRADQWSKESESGLVATVIKHEDIDSIKVCEQVKDNIAVLWLIDGMQRITTCNKYKHNLFAIGKTIKFPIVQYIDTTDGNKVVDYDLRGKYYKDLPDRLKENFDNYELDMIKHLDCTDEDISYHMSRYNDQKSMSSSQKSVLLMPRIAPMIKNISNRDFFENNGHYTPNERKSGIVDRVVSEALSTIYYLDSLKRGKKMCELLDKSITEEQILEFNSELDVLEQIINQDELGKGIFNSKNSMIYFKSFHIFKEFGIENERFAEFLKEFKNNLQHNKVFEEYGNRTFATYDKEVRSTKDKKTIVEKVNMVVSLMNEYFANEISEKNVTDNVKEQSELEFLQENVSKNIIEEDISFYKECLNDYLVVVDSKSKLLEIENEKSLLAICAYSLLLEEDLDKWLEDFSLKNNDYIKDQKTNYEVMKNDFDSFLKGGK